MIEDKIKRLLTTGCLVLGLSGCAPGFNYTATRQINEDIFQCDERRRAGILIADECSYYGAVIFETNYSPDGPGNGNDERRFFAYIKEGTELRPGAYGYGEPWFKRIVALSFGNCDPRAKECYK